MAAFNIQCPHCGSELEVQDEWANMETTCPICNNPFIIPSRPPVRPELKLRTPAGSVAANNFGNGQQAPPYYGPQPGGYSAPLAVHSSWREQPAAPPPVNPFFRPFVNCFKTKGRASRLEFNLFIFITWPILCLPFIIWYIGISSIANAESKQLQETVFSFIFFIYAFFWTFPITVRRFHDFGYHGLHYLFQFIPILNIVYILYGVYLVFRPSDPEENAFGPRP